MYAIFWQKFKRNTRISSGDFCPDDEESLRLDRNELPPIILRFTSKYRYLSLSVQSPKSTISLILQTMVELYSLLVSITDINHSIGWIKNRQNIVFKIITIS